MNRSRRVGAAESEEDVSDEEAEEEAGEEEDGQSGAGEAGDKPSVGGVDGRPFTKGQAVEYFDAIAMVWLPATILQVKRPKCTRPCQLLAC